MAETSSSSSPRRVAVPVLVKDGKPCNGEGNNNSSSVSTNSSSAGSADVKFAASPNSAGSAAAAAALGLPPNCSQSGSMVSFYHQTSSASCAGTGSSLAALGGYQRHSLTPTLGMTSHGLPHHHQHQQQHHHQQQGLMCATTYLPPLQSRAW